MIAPVGSILNVSGSNIAIVAAGPERVAAFVAEPIVGATLGAVTPPDGYWPAIADVCRRHGALLVMKSRHKDPFPRYALRLADRTFYDLSHHPPTILELLSVASLCIHFYSTAVMEAVYSGVPSLCLAPRAEELGPASYGLDFVHNGDEDGFYNAPGVAYWRPLVSAFEGLREWTLDDFPVVPEARRRYVERFLGFDDGRFGLIELQDLDDLRVGDRVRVDGSHLELLKK